MKKISILALLSLSFNLLSANAFELEYIHLKNGYVIDAKMQEYDIPIEKINILEMKDDNDNSYILDLKSNKIKKKLDFFNEQSAMKMGGDGTGGGGGGG